jgi:hypothetical protein
MGGAAANIPLIGWGKPTPVNPLRWRNKNVANVMVSIAGILANLSIALFALVLIKIIQHTNLFDDGTALSGIFEPVWMLLTRALLLNVSSGGVQPIAFSSSRWQQSVMDHPA